MFGGYYFEGEVVEGEMGSPPYVRVATMTPPLGHSLNLTKWEDPHDSEAPYAALNHLGIPRIAIETTDLDADIEILLSLFRQRINHGQVQGGGHVLLCHGWSSSFTR